MKMIRIFLLSLFLLIGISGLPLMADELDDLADLSDDGDGLTGLVDERVAGDDVDGLLISFGGYIKSLMYWNQERYADLLWAQYQALAAASSPAPGSRDMNGINNLGTRAQLNIEGFLGDSARFYSAFNLNYNRATSIHATPLASDDTTKMNGEFRMVESYVELYEGRRIWKIGPQLVTWGFMEGMEVPTDRINARDHSYKSTEYEDSKLSSPGILLTQNIGDESRLEVMWIPLANTNVSMEFLDYLFTNSETAVENQLVNGKIAAQFVSNIGPLDYAISYVDGLDPDADLNAVMVAPFTYVYGRTYNRIQSPGLDLQWNFDSWAAKISWVGYTTEDSTGADPLTKNNWSKTVAGVEFTAFDNIVNLYVGQTAVEDFQNEQTSFLLGQIAENINFISGHMNFNFLTGDALNLIILAANYWDGDGDSIQTVFRSTLKYKITNGLEILFSPGYMNLMDNELNDLQLEVKYSF